MERRPVFPMGVTLRMSWGVSLTGSLRADLGDAGAECLFGALGVRRAGLRLEVLRR